MSDCRLFLISTLLMFFLLPHVLQADSVHQDDLLTPLISEALLNNPDLLAAEQRWQMNEHRVGPARSLDDPVLTLGLNNYPIDTFAGDQTPMTGRDVVLSQKFPFPGKLAAKGDVAKQQALWYRGVYEDLKLKLVQQVKDAYLTCFLQNKSVEITEKNLKLLDDFIRLTEIRYQVGQGLQQDVLKVQVERSKLMDRLFSLRQQQQTALASIASLLGRETPLVLLEIPEPLLLDLNLSPVDLSTAAETERPLFTAYRSLIDRYKMQKHLAELDYRPDFNLFLGYKVRELNRVDDGTDFVSGGVSFNLPVWRQKRAEGVAEADSGVRMANLQLDDLRTKVRFNIQDACAQMERSRQQVLLYKSGIIPQANQALQAAISAYQVGKVEFLSLLDAQSTLFRYETDYFRVLTDYRRSLARLEAESGVTLKSKDMAIPVATILQP